MLLLVLIAAFLVVLGLIVFKQRHLSLLMSLACFLGVAITLILIQDRGWWPQ